MTRARVCPQLEQTREGADGTTPEGTPYVYSLSQSLAPKFSAHAS